MKVTCSILVLPNESNEITGLLEAWIEFIKDTGFFTSSSNTSPFSQPMKSIPMILLTNCNMKLI